MKFKRICALCTALACTWSNAALAEATEVFIDGTKIEDVRVENEKVYVSIDEAAMALGADITLSGNNTTMVSAGGDAKVINTIKSVGDSVVAIVGTYDDGYTSSGVKDYNESYAHGAGVVIKSNGTILTNAHVVKDIEDLTVIFGDGKTYAGQVKYIDETSDLAVVRINEQDLVPVKFAAEDSLMVGQTVIAIGTPLSVNLINAATKGIVSGIDVNIGQHYLFTQSDVAINGGNSGGPLININGELVGINSIKYAGNSIEGMSFSIPVSTINYVLESFEKYGRVVRPETGIEMSEPWEILLGVPTTKGLTVTSSENELILPGDMITHVNGLLVHSIAEYNEAIKDTFSGDTITVTYKRNGVSETAVLNVEADYTKEDDGKVEIWLKSGDASLLVNGESVETKAPFVTPEGVTMVPLRVIADGFGAETEWNQEEKKITITYEETSIVMQIDSLTVSVNGEELAMTAAAMLVDDTTMVPLRFVSETFGAEVGYNNDTGEITVVKETGIEGSTISSSTDLPRIGDSYWNWSMLRPASMMMTERSLDGKETSFSGEDSYIMILVIEEEDMEEGMSAQEAFDEAYDSAKNSDFENMVVSKNEKGEDENGNQYFTIAARSKSTTEELYAVLSGDVIYTVVFYSYSEEDTSKAYSNIISSFTASFAENDEEKSRTYDLSSMDEDGYAVMDDKDLKVSFKIPAKFTEDYQSRSAINLIVYSKEDTNKDYVSVKAFSMSDTVNASVMADAARNIAYEYANKNVVTVSEVMTVEECQGYENVCYYTTETEDLTGGDYKQYNVYFEKGAYVYQFVISTTEKDSKIIKKITESFDAEVLDEEEMGVIMSDIRERKDKDFSDDDWKLTLTTEWEKSSYSSYFTNVYSGATLSCTILDASTSGYSSAKEMMNSLVSNMKNDANTTIVAPVSQKTFGNNTYYTCTVKVTEEDYYTEEDVTEYVTYYVIKKGKEFYRFTFAEPEECYGARAKEDVEKALGTLTVE